MKISKIILIFLVIPFIASAQQEEQYTMYMLNQHGINPGYAGLENSLHGTAVYRQQYSGLAGAPQIANINVHMPLYLIGGGIGFRLLSDTRGATQDIAANFSYSYHLRLDNNSTIGIGLGLGIIQRSLDGAKLRAPEGSYDQGIITHNDPILPTNKVSGAGAKVDAGLFWQHPSFSLGLGVYNLAGNAIVLDENLQIIQDRHFSFFAESGIDIGSSFVIKPSILVRSDLIQNEVHLSARAIYDDFIMLGSSFRGFSANNTDALSIFGGAQVNDKVFLSYAYDITLSDLSFVSRGSHEIMLNYNLGKPIGKGKLPKIIFNPRF